MLIKNIFMELRSRLRSCNVYITTTIDFMKNFNLKIQIHADSIILNYYPKYSDDEYEKNRRDSVSSADSLSDCFSEEDSDFIETIPIDQFCRIVPNSMSGLKIEKNSISFRILTEPRNGGNFYKELLSTLDKPTKNDKNRIDGPKIDLRANEEVKIVCANCVNIISDNVVKFERVLELPSENIDMSDWFCHNHGNTSHSKEPVTLKTNKFDFLYRLCYFKINNYVLSEKGKKFNSKRCSFNCNRCLAWLGVKMDDTVKFFNSTIKISGQGNDRTILKYQAVLKDTSVNDFIHTIESMTKEFNLGLQYTIMCKLILECNVTANERHFLLIWVMDRELQVLRNTDDFVATENEDKIKLVSANLTKILYKVETSLSDEVASWMADPSVTSSEISKCMFVNGIEHLRQMSTKVPESFRSTNGYFVTYLKV